MQSCKKIFGRLLEIDHWAKEIQRVPRNAPLFFLWLVQLVCRRDLLRVSSLASADSVSLYIQALALLEDLTVRYKDQKSTILELQVKRYRQRLGAKPFTLLSESID